MKLVFVISACLFLAACGGSTVTKTVTSGAANATSSSTSATSTTSTTTFTAESVKAKVQQQLVAESKRLDRQNGDFGLSTVTADCIATSATKLNCQVSDTNIPGGPQTYNVIVDPSSGETRITGGH